MRQSVWLGVVMVLCTLMTSCEKNAWRNYQMGDYQGEFKISKVTNKADWSRRHDFASLVFNNKIWVLGGYSQGSSDKDTYLEDVWSSENGSDWQLVVEKAPWNGRRGHALISFNDGSGEAMYLIGGFTVNENTGYRQYANDVWKSNDGKEWVQIKSTSEPYFNSTSDWYPRFNHAVEVIQYNNKNSIILIGGASLITGQSAERAMQYFNDVWQSYDGITWERLSNNEIGKRAEHASAVNSETGEIFIQGGWHGKYFTIDSVGHEPITNYRWVRKSTNGIDWQVDSLLEISTTQGVPSMDTIHYNEINSYLWRANHEIIFYKGSLWGFPGKDPEKVLFSEENRRGIWRRHDEKLYHIDSKHLPCYGRYGYGLLNWQGKLWLLGGYTADQGPANDIWTFELN